MASGASSAVQREAPTLKDKLLTAYPDFALFVGVSLSACARSAHALVLTRTRLILKTISDLLFDAYHQANNSPISISRILSLFVASSFTALVNPLNENR